MASGHLHRDERALCLKQLHHRAQRLARLAKLPHGNGDIPAVLGLGVWQLLKAAIPLCGDQLRDQFFEWLGARFRDENDLCLFCGSEKPTPGAVMCQDCFDEATEMDRQALLEDADEGRPQ